MEQDADLDFCNSSLDVRAEPEQESHSTVTGNDDQNVADNTDGDDNDGTPATASTRNVRAKLSHPSSPRSRDQAIDHVTDDSKAEAKVEAEGPGPRKVRVIVKDVAYTTYRSVLYYVS